MNRVRSPTPGKSQEKKAYAKIKEGDETNLWGPQKNDKKQAGFAFFFPEIIPKRQ